MLSPISPALRTLGLVFAIAGFSTAIGFAAGTAPASPDPRWRVGRLLASDDFDRGLDHWKAELEKGGTVTAQGGRLEIEVPGGATLWWKAMLEGPVLIEYEATVLKGSGANDRVSDLNCFWMARDARSPADIFAAPRTGAFADYDQLKCYYVGLGGNGNTTTRFRRYIGEKGNRPILPEHDLAAKEFMLVPDAAQKIQLLAAGPDIAYYRDGRRLFAYEDPEPYRSGWFAFRTTWNHMAVRHFRVYALEPISAPNRPAP
ncbi:MAG TPA: DUF6250 domain-containing protein [Opitutaceae bacterium]|nr:DUF6250 domain-containing protein [Opitutaceae bacterium]